MEPKEREIQITQLCRVFMSDMPPGVNVSPRPIVEQLLEKNRGDFAITLEDILNFDYDTLIMGHKTSDEKLEKNQNTEKLSNHEVFLRNTEKKLSEENLSAEKLSNHEVYLRNTEKKLSEENLSAEKSKEKYDEELLQSMFGGDFTKSIISAVYTQNKGDVTLTIDLLLNISNDEETIEAIRNMDGQQRRQLEDDMKKEQQQRLKERCLKLEMEIQFERSNVTKLENMGARQQFVMKEKLKEIEEEHTSEVQLIKLSDVEIHKLVHNQHKQDHEHNQHDHGLNHHGHKQPGHDHGYNQYGNAYGHYNHINVHHNHVHVHDDHVHAHDDHVHVHDDHVRVHDDHVRVHDDHVRVRDDHVRVRDDHVHVHDDHVRVHDDHVHVHNGQQHWSSNEGSGIELVHIEQKKDTLKQNLHKEHKQEIVRMQEEIERVTEDHKKQIQKKKDDIAQKELFVSKIIQQVALCTLSVRYGRKTVIVSWSLGKDMKSSPGDWIGFYKLGQPPQRYRQFIRTGGNRQDHHHFPAPKTPGLYYFKYFVNDSYNEIAESDVIHIGPRVTMTATLAENPTDERKNEIEVKYTLMEGEISANDWFGLYPASEKNNKNYISYHKIGRIVHESSKIPELNSGNNSGFRFPAPRIPGDYIVKFFPSQCGYTPITTTDTIRIPNKDLLSSVPTRDGPTNRIQSIHVTWNIFSVDPSPYDYIALYHRDALNNNYEDYKYINPKNRTVIFEAPVKLGIYDFRYHSGNLSKYSDVVRSEPIEIVNTDVVLAHLERSGVVRVTWNIDSQPRTTWDWVGIYRKGEPNKNYISCKYIQPSLSSLTFECPMVPGIYEARYFSSKIGNYTDFRSSNQFVVL